MSAVVRDVTGMCAHTGTLISGVEHVRQSVSRIILTLIGTRIQRREFGADILQLVSAPANEATRVKAIAAVATAILKFEPRVKLSHILFNVDFAGRGELEVNYSYRGQAINQQVEIFGGAR